MSIEWGFTWAICVSIAIGFVVGRIWEMAVQAKKGRSHDY